MAYKKSIIDQNLKGIAHPKRLPCPWKVQNWNGRGRLNFWATPSKFWRKWYFFKIYKWCYYHLSKFSFLHRRPGVEESLSKSTFALGLKTSGLQKQQSVSFLFASDLTFNSQIKVFFMQKTRLNLKIFSCINRKHFFLFLSPWVQWIPRKLEFFGPCSQPRMYALG